MAETRFLIRKVSFIHIFVGCVAALSLALCWTVDRWSGLVLGLIAVTTVFARLVLMPAINAAMDRDEMRCLD
jgi:hypothetical protein